MNKKNNVSEKIFEMIKRACSEWDKPWSKMPDDEKEMAIDDYIKIYEEGKKEGNYPLTTSKYSGIVFI